ncbi:MAG TPA: NADH-quinone oxidoreductase [Verrucomicrobia bacterium]|nr:MAG: NADH-quinone oxidoreductase [Lentisphaerae bacterium GWF2_57_35]HBA84644.1 NADH-quinone oxidoreductase [Verrucomicrobiota bacterium]
MSFPMIPELLGQLLKKPATNPFPAPQLPPTITGYLKAVGEGKATMNPPVPVPPNMRGKMVYNRGTCIGCSLCIKVCPARAIELVPQTKKVRIFVSQCINCGQCTEVCPKNCLNLSDEFLIADTDRYSDKLVLG